MRAGGRGLVVAGTSFILPAAAIVLACAVAYVRYGQTPSGQALLYGVKPVVIAIIRQALVKLGRTALTGDMLQWIVAGAALAAYLVGANEIALLLVGAVAIGQFTPGPLFTTATFIGYVLAGVPGAAVATIGIFLPAFCFVAAVGPFVEQLRLARARRGDRRCGGRRRGRRVMRSTGAGLATGRVATASMSC